MKTPRDGSKTTSADFVSKEPSRRVEIAQQALLALNGGGADAFLKDVTDDVVFRIAGRSPLSQVYNGKIAAHEFVSMALSKFRGQSMPMEIARTFESGNSVICIASSDAITKWGKPYRNEYCYILDFQSDRIMAITEFCDTQYIFDVIMKR